MGSRQEAGGGGSMYKPGDRVVYLASKHSSHPTPRAVELDPEPNGEGYSYAVRKYWVVQEVLPDGTLSILTRRGKQRVVKASDNRLRPARWWERWFLAGRFPEGEGNFSG
ncbi:hypothetical protein ETAA8_14740 [Anatilimnocola aggregata]|uniref:Uncharacterized protein n=1 Tax=Anatilimnocola aggregata TaxID=2528021 RepID=A0A517Y846_9BACT|nr:hypothetical protein [Anatilimnocola aggregata]QDU26396.1 hypothetical protein ETAA8_14740 [Anatilimnocola aggregata]